MLSAFFWILTIGAYARYAERPSLGRYSLALVCFALGLMSKPMVVALPCVLLLLDYWPLGRMRKSHSVGGLERQSAGKVSPRSVAAVRLLTPAATFRRLVFEKIPFLLLTLGSCVITYIAQQKGAAMLTTGSVPMNERWANAAISYVRYIGKMFWPDHLAIFYPYVRAWPGWQIAAAALVLMAMTLLAFWGRRDHRYLATGWLWYLGTLVPVIGLVQVGAQSMADRYTYIPLIGLFVVVSWGAVDLSKRWPMKKMARALGASAALAGCIIIGFAQVRIWQDSVSLFTHALAVTPESAIGHLNLATDSWPNTNPKRRSSISRPD